MSALPPEPNMNGKRLVASHARVLTLLQQAGAPLKAYDLMARYSDGTRPANPPTIYRALAKLCSLGLAHRLASLDAFVACRSPGQAHHPAFLLCVGCGGHEEISAPLDWASGGRSDFSVTSAVMEATGRCALCRGRPGEAAS